MQIIQSILVFVFIGAVATLDLPSGLTACKQSDSKCLETAFNTFTKIFSEGSKEYGIPKIDPLLLKKIHIPGNGGSIDLEQTYEDTNLYGLTHLTANSVTAKVSDSECNIVVDCFVDDLEFIGTYTAVGKMLLFQINGGGAANLTLKDTSARFDISCETYDNGGEKYLKVKYFGVKFLDTKLFIDYKNLVNNNQELSDTVLRAMNENSEDVFKYLKDDYGHVYSDIFTQIANSFWEKVPLSKLFLD